jgi:hypothetical protein
VLSMSLCSEVSLMEPGVRFGELEGCGGVPVEVYVVGVRVPVGGFFCW